MFDASKKWFQTLQGMLTGVAGVIVAVGAIIKASDEIPILHFTPQNQRGMAGFPCSKAATEVEKLICKNSNLGGLDQQLNALYRSKKEQVSELDREALMREQVDWIRHRDLCENYNDSVGCIERSYHTRIAVLEEFTSRPSQENQGGSEADPASGRPPTLPTPSFNCFQAKSLVERNICSDSTLSKLDSDVNIAYNALLKTLPNSEKSLQRKNHAAWLQRRDACGNAEKVGSCLETAYRKRLSTLSSR